MKKLLSIFTGVTVLTGAGLNTISCGDKSGKGQIQLVTNGGSINDKSFNQQANEAVIEYAKEIGKKAANKLPTKFGDVGAYLAAYKSAFKSDAEIIIANGATHRDAISKFVMDNKDKWVIFTDDTFDLNQEQMKTVTKASSITFAAEQSGFLAGIAAVYLNLHSINYLDDNKLTVGSFGGMNIPGVTNFMAGLHAATVWWNEKLNKLNGQDQLKKIIKILSEKEFTDTIKSIEDVTGAEKDSDGKFTTVEVSAGFASGGVQANTVIERIVKTKNADVIMPVAGPLTGDLLNYLEKNDNFKYKRVIGVDTNQAKQYSEHQNVNERFITSALKKLGKAIKETLTIWNKTDKTEEEQTWFKGETINKKTEWTGIAPSNEIKEKNITELMVNLKPDLDALYKWWHEDVLTDRNGTFEKYNDDTVQKSLKDAFNKIGSYNIIKTIYNL